MPRKSSPYLREALLLLKSQTDQAPMIFQARYVHRDGRWCTFAQLSVVYPADIGTIDCGHINIARSVVEFHLPLGKSDHHRMVYFVARVASYWYHGDRRGKVMLERLEGLPSICLVEARSDISTNTESLLTKYCRYLGGDSPLWWWLYRLKRVSTVGLYRTFYRNGG